MTRQDPELLTDILDFTTQFYVILRRKSAESKVSIRFAIWSLDLPLPHPPHFYFAATQARVTILEPNYSVSEHCNLYVHVINLLDVKYI